MKTLILAALLVLPLVLAAQPTDPRIAAMAGSCNSVMGQGVCRVENNDKRDCTTAGDQVACRLSAFAIRYPNGLLVAGAGRFTAAEYFQYVDAADKMCEVIVRNCTSDFNSRGCLMARALWSQRG